MDFKDPLAAYNARDIYEAQLVQRLLAEAGIEAKVVEDLSHVGLGHLGALPELHKPQVWIDRTDADRVKTILDEYELNEIERRKRGSQEVEDIWEETIKVECPRCGQLLTFPVKRRGSVEVCPECSAHVDVDDNQDDEDEWWLAGGENVDPPT